MPTRKTGRSAKSRALTATTGTRRTSKLPASSVETRSRRQDALALLAADHRRIAGLFARFVRLPRSGPPRAKLVATICDELDLHTAIEEEIFYPTLRAAVDDDDLMDRAAVEHESIRSLVSQLRDLRPGDLQYDARVTVLGDYVKHHVAEEERRMFPRARKIDVDLYALARAMENRKRELKGGAGVQSILELASYPALVIP